MKIITLFLLCLVGCGSADDTTNCLVPDGPTWCPVGVSHAYVCTPPETEKNCWEKEPGKWCCGGPVP
jgi:hypothetical protein